MGMGHAAMTDWALQQVTIPKDGVILDVGCGGGRTVNKLAGLAAQLGGAGQSGWIGLLGG
jgi:2-polyprenyl-3-methyl-5-hydroxy-6-metoxy-1,4-benzoquinol methylase